jgi:hypothetical protein
MNLGVDTGYGQTAASAVFEEAFTAGFEADFAALVTIAISLIEVRIIPKTLAMP